MASRDKIRLLLCALVPLLIIYLIPVVIFRCSRSLQRYSVFLHHVDPQNSVLSHPEQVGLNCTRVLRLEHPNLFPDHDNGKHPLIHLGVWHILPGSSSIAKCNATNNRTGNIVLMNDKPAFFDDTRPIVLYLHGNNGNRAMDYRIKLYKRLAHQLNYHVVTFDYRAYGDSSDATPSTFGLTSDARFVYDWLVGQPNVTRERVSVWGHSLGTAVAVRLLAELPPERQPGRLILEAAFDSLASQLVNHHWTRLHRNMPFYKDIVVTPLVSWPELNFDSLGLIGNITSTPIMFLHAEDDEIVAHKLGKNLYEEAVKKLGQSKVKFIPIAANYSLGHDHIPDHNETLLDVNRFIGV